MKTLFVTETQAKEEINKHIASGKMFMLGAGHLMYGRHNGFWWRGVWVEQPITIGKMLSREEIKRNWYEGMGGLPQFPYYFEVILD